MSKTTYHWTVASKIGDQGGFAQVYRAIKKVDGKALPTKYAVKKLSVTDNESIRRFQKEVRLLKDLNHPRVVKVEGYNLSQEPYFYAMPLYRGSLRSKITDYEGDYDRIRRVINEILDGVEYLHQQGVIHRDLKPENILINSDTDLVISDLGLGLDVNSDSTRVTLSGQGMGSLWYLPPEQYSDAKNVDERADIFSLGKIISEMFGVRRGSFDLTSLPAAVRHVVERSTHNHKEQRYPSISDLRTAFNLVMEILVNGVQKGSITSALAAVVEGDSSGEIEENTIREFVGLLSQSLDDLDIIHDVMMQLPSTAFSMIQKIDLDFARELTAAFVQHITSQGWGFDYTDKIGSQCAGFYGVSTDAHIRCELLYAIAEVGISHNRWYVMGIAERLITSVSDASESLLLLDRLKSLDLDRLDLTKPKVNAVLQRLF